MLFRSNPGPLVGILTGLDWVVANLPGLEWIVSVPTDAPFLPHDLVARMLAAVEEQGSDMACAVSNGQRHPVVGLWSVAHRMELRYALIEEGVRKVDAWTGRYKVADVEFSTDPVDPFFNANRLEDLERAEALLA